MSCARSARRWPAVDILIRGDSHYSRPEAMAWLERNRVGYIFGLAGNKVLLGKVAASRRGRGGGRIAGEAVKVRRYGDVPLCRQELGTSSGR